MVSKRFSAKSLASSRLFALLLDNNRCRGCCPSATRKVIKLKIYTMNKSTMLKYHALQKSRSQKWEGTFCIQAFIVSWTMSSQYNCCSCFIHNVIYILVLHVQIQTTTNTKTISPNRMEMSEKAWNIRLSRLHCTRFKIQKTLKELYPANGNKNKAMALDKKIDMLTISIGQGY